MRRSLALAALLTTSCATKPVPGVKVDPSLAMLVPADTVLLAGVRLEALQKTPVYQKYLATRSFPFIDDFAKQTGVDPRKNLWEVLFVSNGKQSVLLGRGKFSNEEEPRLENDGGRRFGYKGFNFVGDDRTAVVLINSTTAAAGETDALKALIDQRENSHGPPPSLAALMRDIPPDAQIWAAYAGGRIDLPLQGNLANANKLLGSIGSGSLYFDLRTGLNGVATGLCATDQEAQDVQGALKALIGMGRLTTPSGQKDVLRVYDGIQVTQESHRVTVHIDEPEELAEKFIDLWMKR